MASPSEDSCIGNHSRELQSLKILILGEIGIGKTALIKSYLGKRNMSVEKLDNEERDIFFKMYPLRREYNENAVDVRLIDLYPGANSPERRECYPVDVNVIILCFSIGHYHTLKSVYKFWIHEVRSHYGKLTPVLLVGLRSDVRFIKPDTLLYSMLCREGIRIVEKSKVEVIHKNYQFHGDYMECSLYDKDSVIHVIEKALRVAMSISV